MSAEYSWKTPTAILGVIGVVIAAAAIVVPLWVGNGSPPNPPSTAQDLEGTAKVLSGTWEGTYRCNSRLTGMNLTIYVVDDSNILATWAFYGTPENPDTISGSFAMEGTFGPSSLNLTHDYWIDQPRGYYAADLTAPLDFGSDQVISGEVSGCDNFEVRKVSDETRRPVI